MGGSIKLGGKPEKEDGEMGDKTFEEMSLKEKKEYLTPIYLKPTVYDYMYGFERRLSEAVGYLLERVADLEKEKV